jgi:glycosyltransferase involved in cell wall biosynthesis
MFKEDKIRVLLLGPTHPSIGGITTAVNMLMCSELARKYDIRVTANSNKRPMNKKGKIDIYNTASAFLILVRVIYEIYIFRPKVVQVETSGGIGFLKQSIYIIAAWILRCKVITSLHCANEDEPLIEFTKNGKLSRWYCGWVLQRSNKIKLLSSKWSTSFAVRWGLSNDKVFGLKNCIDTSFPWGKSLSVQHQSDAISVVSVGSVGERKGSFLLIEAIRQLRADGISISLILVGPEERAGNLAALKNSAINGSVENYVKFMGGQPREKTIEILTKADVFALPSYAEGMPYSIIEALAVGCPVIASDVGAVRDVIVNEETGLLIEAGNIDQLVNALHKMVNDKMFRKNLAVRGNMFARKEFGIHNLENVLGAIYDEL